MTWMSCKPKQMGCVYSNEMVAIKIKYNIVGTTIWQSKQ
jgi:hypothetical protein